MNRTLSGYEMDRMPDSAFKLMKLFFKVYYFFKPAGKYLEKFGIKPGNIVVDYGCGPGDYIKPASNAAGDEGLVYAVDIHEMAIASVEKLIRKYNLKNVRTVLTDGITVGIEDNVVDIIYAIDMFHMVKETDRFLRELSRIIKEEGYLIIEDGHQPRSLAIEKIKRPGCWKIIEENRKFLKCKAVKNASVQA